MNRLISLGKTSPFCIQLAFIIGKQLIQIMLTKTRGAGKFNRVFQKTAGNFHDNYKNKEQSDNRSQPRKNIYNIFFKQTMLTERIYQNAAS
jgi:hypothetical protein